MNNDNTAIFFKRTPNAGSATRLRLFATATLLASSFAFIGCSDHSSNVVFIADEPTQTVAQNTELNVAQTISTFQTPSASDASALANLKPENQTSKPETTLEKITQPKFDPKGVSVDVSEINDFSGVYNTSEFTKWRKVKVVRGKGPISRGALETFANLPELTEFLWTQASIDGDDKSLFEQLTKAPKLQKIRLDGLTLKNKNAFPSFILPAIKENACKTLKELDLSNSAITDSDLRQAGFDDNSWVRLTKLVLYHTQIADDGVKEIVKIDSLQSLNLDDTKITNESMTTLMQKQNLTFLHIGRTTVDDDGILKLARLVRLEKIHVTRTRATEEGANRLRQALPNCVVVSQPE